MSLEQLKLKLIICGDHEVGKTSLAKSYLGMKFSPDYNPTMGVDIYSKSYKHEQSHIIDLRIWDLAGQVLYRDLSEGYIKGADLVMIVYDVTSTESFLNVEGWYNKVYKVLGKKEINNPPCLIIGNKVDLKQKRVVTGDQGIKLAEDLDSLYSETSAKEGRGVHEAFNRMILEYIKISKFL